MEKVASGASVFWGKAWLAVLDGTRETHPGLVCVCIGKVTQFFILSLHLLFLASDCGVLFMQFFRSVGPTPDNFLRTDNEPMHWTKGFTDLIGVSQVESVIN